MSRISNLLGACMNFREMADKKYGAGTYDYSLVEDKPNPKYAVRIVCPDHGMFALSPDAFIYTAGCPACRGKHPRGYPVGVKKRKAGRGRPRLPSTLTVLVVTADMVLIGVERGKIFNPQHRFVCSRYFPTQDTARAAARAIKALFPNPNRADVPAIKDLMDRFPIERRKRKPVKPIPRLPWDNAPEAQARHSLSASAAPQINKLQNY